MTRMLIMTAAVCLWAGCQETRVIEDNSATAKFMSMMGGTSAGGGETQGAWQITRNDQPKQARKANEPEARVIKEADFSSYKFSTNLQIDEGRPRPGQPALAAPGSATQPAAPGNAPAGSLPVPGSAGTPAVGPGGMPGGNHP